MGQKGTTFHGEARLLLPPLRCCYLLRFCQTCKHKTVRSALARPGYTACGY